MKQLKLHSDPGDDPSEVEAVAEQLQAKLSQIKDIALNTKKGAAEADDA